MKGSIIFLLFTALILLPSGLNAQKIDSLRKVLDSSFGIDKYEVLYDLAYEYSDVNDSISLVYAAQAYDLALKLGDSTRIIRSGRIQAGELRRLERIDEAILVAQYVLRIARRFKNSDEIKMLLNSLALSHTFKTEYDKALTYNFESLLIREADGNEKEISMTLNNIGLIYYKLNDHARSANFYKKSLEIKRRVNDRYDRDRLLINIGLSLNAIGDHEGARKYINEGLRECQGDCSEQIIIEGELGLGISFLKNSYKESLRHFEHSYTVAKRIGNYRFQAENIVCFAKLHLTHKDYENAKRYLKEAESISTQHRYGYMLIETYELFSKLYKINSDYKNTSLYQSKYITLKDSLYSDKLISNLALVQTAYEERENIKAIADRDEVLSLKEELIKKQNLETALMASTIIMLVVVIAMLYRSYRNKLLSNIRLEQIVKERTEELRGNNSQLVGAFRKQKLLLERAEKDGRSIVASITGLCNAAQLELSDEKAREYIQRIDDRLTKLIIHFQVLKSESEALNKINS